MSATDTQVGGNHYKDLSIQPVEYIHANSIGYFEGNVIKYVTRWKSKGGVSDLEKAKHYIELLIELESKELNQPDPVELKDGWIKWVGGDCPVDRFETVEVKLACGTESLFEADQFHWEHNGDGSDIVGYRIVDKPVA